MLIMEFEIACLKAFAAVMEVMEELVWRESLRYCGVRDSWILT